MKNLLIKELKLVISPFAYMFAALSALLLIPNYPYIVGVSWFIQSVNLIFTMANTNKDSTFTAMLPISRNTIVFSKHLTVFFVEMLHIIAAIPFALLTSLLVTKSGNTVGMDANFAFFGYILIAFSVFNIIFLTQHFKTGYKAGMPTILGLIGYAIFCIAFEIIVAFVPVLHQNLDSLSPATFVYQIIFLIVGVAVYFGSMFASYKISVKKFERVNL